MGNNFKGLMFLHFLNDGVRTAFVTLLPFIAKDLSLSLSVVGFLGSAQPVFASILALPAGFFASKLGGFHFLVYLLIIYSLGAISAATSFNVNFVILSFSIAALGFGMFHTVGFSLVAKSSEKEKIGKNMGDFTSIGDIGRVCIPPLMVFLVPVIGWRYDFVLISIAGLITFLLIKFSLSKKEVYNIIEKQSRENHQDFLRSLLQLLKNRNFFLTLLSAILDSLASSPIYIFLPFLLFSKGIQITEFGIFITMFLFGSLAGKLVLGRMVDKIGNIKMFTISEIIMAVGLILLTLTSNFYIMLFLSLILGAFTRGTTPVVQSMFSKAAHKDHYDKVFALSELFVGISAVVTIIFMGAVADKIGIHFVFYATAILAILAIFPAILVSKKAIS